jgi:hypothetical protein
MSRGYNVQYMLLRGVCSTVFAQPQSAYRGRVEIRGSVSALLAGAYTTTLYMMVDIVNFFHHDGMDGR